MRNDIGPGRRVGTTVAALAMSALVGGCAAGGPMHRGAPPAGRSTQTTEVRIADAQMPIAPGDHRAWLHAVDRAYASAGDGRGAEHWLRQRMANRRPGERLAVVLGIDDVMVQTRFAGTRTLVPRSVRFVKTAHALGYSVIYVTGRSYAHGLGGIEAHLERASVPGDAFYGRPPGAADEATAKARCRAAIQAQGYTLAMSVAADGASFVGSPRAEQEIRLPDFAFHA